MRDSMFATDFADSVFGGDGADDIHGLGGSDLLEGGAGIDSLNGDSGADVLDGGDGNDILVGGAGVDSWTGGAGADLFILAVEDLVEPLPIASAGITDAITDFATGVDSLLFPTAADATNYFESAVPELDLTALLKSASGKLDATVVFYLGVIGSDGYLVHTNGTDVDAVVKLTGVTHLAVTDIDAY
jgi:Ca2+-binding RTX toxin-like protein